MKLSRLMRELVTQLAEHGDCEVLVAIKTADADYKYAECQYTAFNEDNNELMLTGKEMDT